MKNLLSVSHGDPVTVIQAPADVRHWGPYQFPGLQRLPDGRIQVGCQVGADSATAVGLPPLQAVSADEGRTWTVLPRPKGQLGAVNCTQAPLCLANGKQIQIKMLPLADDTALIAYSEFNIPGPDGTPRKSIRVRTIKVGAER